MSLPLEFLQWMKDSQAALQEQIRKQAEDQATTEQQHKEALEALKEMAQQDHEDFQKALDESNEGFREALKEVAKQGHTLTAAVIAGMNMVGDGTAFKDLVKLKKTYMDPDML